MRIVVIAIFVIFLFYLLAWACTPTVTEMHVPQHEDTPQLAIVGGEVPEEKTE